MLNIIKTDGIEYIVDFKRQDINVVDAVPYELKLIK